MLWPPWKNSISRAVGQAELRVEEPHLGVLVRHPLIAADQVEMAALDHERPRHHQIGHLRVVERVPQFQYGISHSIVRMKLKGSSVAATLRVHWLKSPEQIDRRTSREAAERAPPSRRRNSGRRTRCARRRQRAAIRASRGSLVLPEDEREERRPHRCSPCDSSQR